LLWKDNGSGKSDSVGGDERLQEASSAVRVIDYNFPKSNFNELYIGFRDNDTFPGIFFQHISAFLVGPRLN
jgi:hypothetical protein